MTKQLVKKRMIRSYFFTNLLVNNCNQLSQDVIENVSIASVKGAKGTVDIGVIQKIGKPKASKSG